MNARIQSLTFKKSKITNKKKIGGTYKKEQKKNAIKQTG